MLTKTKLYIGEYIYIYNGHTFQEDFSDTQLLRDSRDSVQVLGSIIKLYINLPCFLA
jgi:hypothetical protein